MPVLLLPVTVFWRMVDEGRKRMTWAATAAAGIVALVLSLPRDARPDTFARDAGSAIEDHFADYELRKSPRKS